MQQDTISLFEDEFRLAIHQIHNCEPQSLEAVVDVKIPPGTGASWSGKVHVFQLSSHPKAKRCYAWPEPLGGTAVIIRAVLHSGRVASAEQAVKSVLRRRRG
jgi:hypothetical protein